MFGRRSDGVPVGAVDAGTVAARPGSGDDFACAVGAGPTGAFAGGLVAPDDWIAAGLAGAGFAAAGFATWESFAAGWTAPLPCAGLACFAGAVVFFATVVWLALAGGFAAARCEAAWREAGASRSGPAVPADAFIPDTFSFVPQVSRSVRQSAR
jgi:hypothetical protein